jgi:hypothetical protein
MRSARPKPLGDVNGSAAREVLDETLGSAGASRSVNASPSGLGRKATRANAET